MDKGKILQVLNRVCAPDYIDRSVLDMGLVTEDDITREDNGIEVAYGLTAPHVSFQRRHRTDDKVCAGEDTGGCR